MKWTFLMSQTTSTNCLLRSKPRECPPEKRFWRKKLANPPSEQRLEASVTVAVTSSWSFPVLLRSLT